MSASLSNAEHGAADQAGYFPHSLSLRTAYATLKGFEVMRALKTGQGTLLRYLPGVAGELSLVHRAFGLT